MTRPKLWKVKRDGRRIGSWHFTAPGGKRVNTNTADAVKANKFQDRYLAKIAKAAQSSDVEGAAAATIAALDTTGDAEGFIPTSLPETPPPTDSPAAGSVALPVVQADQYIPPPPAADTGDWAGDAARAAAGGTAGPAAPSVDPEFLDGVIEQAATLLVELQISGQEWGLRRGLKIKAGEVAGDSRSREPGVQLWKTQLRKWLPSDIDAPEWLLAVIITAATTVPIQLANATPLPKDGKPNGQTQATSEAVGVAA